MQEFRSVVGKLRTELNDAFKNAEDLLENIGKPKVKGKCKGTPNDYLLFIYNSFHYLIEVQHADTVEGVDTTGDSSDEKGLDLEEKVGCKAEAKAGSSDAEGRLGVVHTGIMCKGCKVRTSLITDYFRCYL